jgi:superfamily II DNA/RNA helicase
VALYVQYVHRCGRAGRSQKANDSGSKQKAPVEARVHSFFTDELAPIANGVLSLLQESNASEIDPKLLELVNASDDDPYNSNVGSAGKKMKKQGSSGDYKTKKTQGK